MADSPHSPPEHIYRPPNVTEPNISTSFSLPASHKSKIEGIASVERRSAAAILRLAVAEYIEQWERLRDDARLRGDLADGDQQP
jgi:predicted transcriptional regulator